MDTVSRVVGEPSTAVAQELEAPELQTLAELELVLVVLVRASQLGAAREQAYWGSLGAPVAAEEQMLAAVGDQFPREALQEALQASGPGLQASEIPGARLWLELGLGLGQRAMTTVMTAIL